MILFTSRLWPIYLVIKQRNNNNKYKNTKLSPVLHLASWNVRLCPGFPDDNHYVNDFRKMAIIDHELKRLNSNIAALQETRLPSDGSLREQDVHFSLAGNPDVLQLHGVSFAVKKSSLSVIKPQPVAQNVFPLFTFQVLLVQPTSWAFTFQHSAPLQRLRTNSMWILTLPW